MTRTSRPALAAGYLVAFAAVQLGLIVVFGYVGPLEVVAAALLAVPVTVLAGRALRAGSDAEGDLDAELEPAPGDAPEPQAAAAT
jgi:hypothetical protein